MVNPENGTSHAVAASTANEFAPEAISFYSALPAHPLRYRDLPLLRCERAGQQHFSYRIGSRRNRAVVARCAAC